MFIEQLLNSEKRNKSLLLYIPFPIIFIGLIVLNYLVIELLNIDVNEIIAQEIKNDGKTLFFIKSLLPFAIGLIILFFWVKYVHQQSIISLTTSRKKIDWNRILFSFCIWSIFTIVSTLLMYYSNPNDFSVNFSANKFMVLLLLSIVLIPIQTSFEEYLFRGYLIQGLGLLTKKKIYPFFLTSIAFGVMHIANPEVEKMGYIILVYYIGTGFFLGILTLMDEGMELALGFHAANNLIGALLVTSDWTAFQTDSILIDKSDPSAGLEILVPIFIIFPLILFLFSKKYKWTNWQDKLFGKIEIKDSNPTIEIDNHGNSY